MKAARFSTIAGLILSLGTGLWHFFVPYLYRWYSYIPNAPRAIVVSIDWTNFFMSFFLAGTSLLLLLFRDDVFRKGKVAFSFYGFLVLAWLCRIVLTIIHPWDFGMMILYQLAAFMVIFSLLGWPFVRMLPAGGRNNTGESDEK